MVLVIVRIRISVSDSVSFSVCKPGLERKVGCWEKIFCIFAAV